MQPFNDVTLSNWNWEDFKLEHIVKDIKGRTDQLKTECDTMKISNDKDILALQAGSTTLKSDLSILYDKLADIQITLNAILLKETSVITEAELRTIYKMLVSPDKENKLVAEEAISNKLKELE